jgi:hypothetical protein
LDVHGQCECRRQDVLFLFGSHGCDDVFSVKSDNRSIFLSICSEFWNKELSDFASNSHDEVPAIENVTDRMELNRQIGCDSSNEIEFIASHFDEMSSSLILIDICLIDVILSHDGLKIKNENLICGFVMSKF